MNTRLSSRRKPCGICLEHIDSKVPLTLLRASSIAANISSASTASGSGPKYLPPKAEIKYLPGLSGGVFGNKDEESSYQLQRRGSEATQVEE